VRVARVGQVEALVRLGVEQEIEADEQARELVLLLQLQPDAVANERRVLVGAACVFDECR
jgi:hypothetical protein